MVKIRITRAKWSDEEQYVGGVYEAFEMRHSDGRIDYCTKVTDEFVLCVLPENCEVLEEAPEATGKSMNIPTGQILMVEDGSVDVDELDEWCSDNGIKLIIYRQGANKPEFLK